MNTTTPQHLQSLQEAARRRGVELLAQRITRSEEVIPALDAAGAWNVAAINVLASPLLVANRRAIIERTAVLRLPAMYQWPEVAEEGGFIAYGPRLIETFRVLVAQQLVKLFRGAKPSDLPVEQPTRFELAINVRAATAIGHEVPLSLLAPCRQGDRMSRRAFITLLGGAAAWPLAARAQPAMPVIGFLNFTSPDGFEDRVRAFRRGLKESGYVEGENVTIEYRWADNEIDRLPELASQLVRQKVAVIAAASTASALAAKAATSTIPIVFTSGGDPVRLGLVTNLARPDGNVTGISFVASELTAKRLELVREMVPGAIRVAVLVNPDNALLAETTLRDVEVAARAMGMQIHVFNATTGREIDAVFASLAGERPDALFVGGDPLFASRRVQLANLAARHAVAMTSGAREIAEAGGLMSYGTNIPDAYRQTGAYAGRILKGAKPADLPAVQASKFELVINAQTARMLGIAVPPTLLAHADEVIE